MPGSPTNHPNAAEAGDGARTRDLRLGKPTLYQLSYSRVRRTLAAIGPGPALDGQSRAEAYSSHSHENGSRRVTHSREAMLDDASSPPPSASPAAETPSAGGSRLSASVDWLKARADTSLGRLTLLWFKRYFEASRNSGAAASAYITLSAVPTALVIAAAFRQAKGDENAFAERLIDHMRLDGATASLVRDVFGSSANNLLAASVTILISFLFWGIGVGQLYQSLYARAWRIHAGTVADQIRFTVWFFVLSGFLAAFILSASAFRAAGWAALLVAWFAGSMIFWLWTPMYLLHRQVSLRSLMPGAILSTLVVGGTIATAPLWISPTLNQNAHAFGDFGVVVAIFAYILIVVTISMVCAVFSPVWFEWRQGENERTG